MARCRCCLPPPPSTLAGAAGNDTLIGSGLADILTGGRPIIYDGTVPWLVFVPNTTTASNVSGVYQETHG